MGSKSSKKEDIQQLESFRSYLDEKNAKVWGGGRKEDVRGRRKAWEEEGRRMEERIFEEDISSSNNCLLCFGFFQKPKPKQEVGNPKLLKERNNEKKKVGGRGRNRRVHEAGGEGRERRGEGRGGKRGGYVILDRKRGVGGGGAEEIKG